MKTRTKEIDLLSSANIAVAVVASGAACWCLIQVVRLVIGAMVAGGWNV